MGRIWNAAVRGEGWQIGRGGGYGILAIVIFFSVFRLTFRFFTGRPMSGQRKTDAEFRTPGTRKLYANDRTPWRWSWLPEWKRAAIRTAVLTVLVASVWAWVTGELFDASILHNALSVAALALVSWTVWFSIVRIDTWVREARHNRTMTRPFKAAVAPILGMAAREVRVHLPRQSMTKKGQDAA